MQLQKLFKPISWPLIISLTLSLCVEPVTSLPGADPQYLSPSSTFATKPILPTNYINEVLQPIEPIYAGESEVATTDSKLRKLPSPYALAHELGHLLAGVLTGLKPIAFEVWPQEEEENPHVRFSKGVGILRAIFIAPSGWLSELLLFGASGYLTYLGADSTVLFLLGGAGLLSGLFHFFNRIEVFFSPKETQTTKEHLTDWEILSRAVNNLLWPATTTPLPSRFNMDERRRRRQREAKANRGDATARDREYSELVRANNARGFLYNI